MASIELLQDAHSVGEANLHLQFKGVAKELGVGLADISIEPSELSTRKPCSVTSLKANKNIGKKPAYQQ